MSKIKSIVEESTSVAGRLFDYSIQFLIVLSLITFSVETLPDLSAQFRQLLRNIEILTVSIFTVEYLLRIIVADRKLKFVFSFDGLIDLAAILPFYVATGLDMRSIRVIRLFRLFRTFKLFRYSRASPCFRARRQPSVEYWPQAQYWHPTPGTHAGGRMLPILLPASHRAIRTLIHTPYRACPEKFEVKSGKRHWQVIVIDRNPAPEAV